MPRLLGVYFLKLKNVFRSRKYKRYMAPFSGHERTFRHPVPKIAENFFGRPFGSPIPKTTIRIDFLPFWGALGALFQKTLKFTFFKFPTFRVNFLGYYWTQRAEIFFGMLSYYAQLILVYHTAWFGLVWSELVYGAIFEKVLS